MAGKAPQCSGSTTCWPMSCPSASVRPQLPSWLSRTMVEKPVRNSEPVTSRTMPERLVAITCRVTGSIAARATVSMSVASHDVDHDVEVLVDGGGLPGVDDGGGVELLHDGRPVQAVPRLQPAAVVDRAAHEAATLTEVHRALAGPRGLQRLAVWRHGPQLHLRHAHHGDQAVAHHLDRRRGRLVAVEALVQAVEARSQPAELRPVQRHLDAGHGQLVALASVDRK